MNDLQSMFDDAQKNRFIEGVKKGQVKINTSHRHVQKNYDRIKKMIDNDWNNEIIKTENNNNLGISEKNRKINHYVTCRSSAIVHLDVALDCVNNGMSESEVERYCESPDFIWDQFEVFNYFTDLIKA